LKVAAAAAAAALLVLPRVLLLQLLKGEMGGVQPTLIVTELITELTDTVMVVLLKKMR